MRRQGSCGPNGARISVQERPSQVQFIISAEVLRDIGVAVNLLKSFREIPVNTHYVNHVKAACVELNDLTARILKQLEIVDDDNS